MEFIEIAQLAGYTVQIVGLLILCGYFLREYMVKRLRASLAWALGFLLLAISIANLAFLATVEISRFAVLLGGVFTAAMISLLYYGVSLIFFREGSFFREKMAAIYFVIMLAVESILTIIAPADRIAETVRGPTVALLGLTFLLIAYLFYRVSRRLPSGDPRKRTTTFVSVAWTMMFIHSIYVALFWGENPTSETVGVLFVSLAYVILLYGMTTGKTTRT